MLGGVVNVDGSVDLFRQLELEAEAGRDGPTERNGGHGHTYDGHQHYQHHHPGGDRRRDADEVVQRLWQQHAPPPPLPSPSPRHPRHHPAAGAGAGAGCDADTWAMSVAPPRRSPNTSVLAPASYAWSGSNETSFSVAPIAAQASDRCFGGGEADDGRHTSSSRSKRRPSPPRFADEIHLTEVSPRESPRFAMASGEPRSTRSRIASSRIPHPPLDASRIPHPPQRTNKPVAAAGVSARRRQRPGVNYEIKSGRTPTDDEINVLWDAVRQGLQAHRDEQQEQEPPQAPQSPPQQHQQQQLRNSQMTHQNSSRGSPSSQNCSRGHTSSGQSSRIRAESALAALAKEQGPGSNSRRHRQQQPRSTVTESEALAKSEAELLNSLSQLEVKISTSSSEKAAKGPRVRKSRRAPPRSKEQSAALRGSVNDASAALAAMAAANFF